MALQLQRVYLLIAVVGSVSAVSAQDCSDNDNVAVASEELALVQRQASVVLMKQQQQPLSAGNDAAAGARVESTTPTSPIYDDNGNEEAARSEPDTTSWNEDDADLFLEKSTSANNEDEEDGEEDDKDATTDDEEFPENLLENTSVKAANRILVNGKFHVFEVLESVGDTCEAHNHKVIETRDGCLEAAKTAAAHGIEFTHMRKFTSKPRPYGCVLRADHKWAALYFNDANKGNGAGFWKGVANQNVGLICFVPHKETDTVAPATSSAGVAAGISPAPTPQHEYVDELLPTSSPTLPPTESSYGGSESPTTSPTTLNPTPSPTPSPTSSPTKDPTLAPTSSPTPSPTSSPTSSPTVYLATPSPTSSPTPSPTSSPTEYQTTPSPTSSSTPYTNDGGSAGGDPHVTNVHGDTFNVFKVGSMDFLRVPLESSVKDANLSVFGTVKDLVGTSDRCEQSRYITSLLFGGAWIGEHRLKVLMQEGEMSVWLGEKPVKTSSEETPIGTRLHLLRSNDDELQLRAGSMHIDVSAGGNHNGSHFFLNIDAKSLASMNCRVGGLLGEDDHAGVSTPPAECQLSSSSQRELVTKHKATSVASASLAE